MGERGEAARRWLIAQVRSENCVGLRADRPRDVRSRYVLDRLKRFPKKRNSGEKEKKVLRVTRAFHARNGIPSRSLNPLKYDYPPRRKRLEVGKYLIGLRKLWIINRNLRAYFSLRFWSWIFWIFHFSWISRMIPMIPMRTSFYNDM